MNFYHQTDNNKVTVIGKVLSGFRYRNTVNGERFYQVRLAVQRRGGRTDSIPLTVSERIVDTRKDFTGQTVRVLGEFRSYNENLGTVSRLLLTVFVSEWEVWKFPLIEDSRNEIYLDGYVCREPVYRKTPAGHEIADIMVAVKRSYGKTDYIPGICWGRNARFVTGGVSVGSHVQLSGKIQSREYLKQKEDNTQEKRTVYEVSVDRIRPLDNP